MGSDVEFVGQLSLSKADHQRWRAARVAKTALRGLPLQLRRNAEAFVVGDLLDAVSTDARFVHTGRTVRLAGSFEEGAFWETWASELAGSIVAAAKLGIEGWLWITGDELSLRVVSDGEGVTVDEPTAAALARARKGAAFKLLDELPGDLDPATQAAVDDAVDRFLHGTKVKPDRSDALESIAAVLEQADDQRVMHALGKADDVPSRRGLARPKQLFKNKAGVLEAFRSSDIVEHRAVAIDVLSRVDAEACTPPCLRLLAQKKTVPAFRCAALLALGRSTGDDALAALIDAVYAKVSSCDRADPVVAAMRGLAASTQRSARWTRCQPSRASAAMPASAAPST